VLHAHGRQAGWLRKNMRLMFEKRRQGKKVAHRLEIGRGLLHDSDLFGAGLFDLYRCILVAQFRRPMYV
jgi:hypothetical protein